MLDQALFLRFLAVSILLLSSKRIDGRVFECTVYRLYTISRGGIIIVKILKEVDTHYTLLSIGQCYLEGCDPLHFSLRTTTIVFGRLLSTSPYVSPSCDAINDMFFVMSPKQIL